MADGATPADPVPAPSGLNIESCAGLVAMHTAAIATWCEDTDQGARRRADLATLAVCRAITFASDLDPGTVHEPVATLEALLYTVSNETTRESVGSVVGAMTSTLSPIVSLFGIDDVVVHASERPLPVDGGYGFSFPLAGGRMLVERALPIAHLDGGDGGDDGVGSGASSRPSVTLTFPASDPHFPHRCARVELVLEGRGLLSVTAYIESDRRNAEAPGVAIGPARGTRVLSSTELTGLFAPSQSTLAATRCFNAAWWIGLHDPDVAMQRRDGGALLAYVVPTFLTRAVAHLATRNFRLHVVANAASLVVAAGQGEVPSDVPLWSRCVALEPATLHTLIPRTQTEDHTLHLRARLHKTYCSCLCRAYSPLVAVGGGECDECDECEPCLDIYMCGRPLISGVCPTHPECAYTLTRSVQVCVARPSVRLKCVHRGGGDGGGGAASSSEPHWRSSTYNSLDHELLLSSAEKRIAREIVSSAYYLRECAVAREKTRVGEEPPTRRAPGPPRYMHNERDRLEELLPKLYDLNYVNDTYNCGTNGVLGVEMLEREQSADLQRLDDLATMMMYKGLVSVEIGKNRTSTPCSFPQDRKLRIAPDTVNFRGVARLWYPKRNGPRVNVPAPNGGVLSYIYGRLFPHLNAPPRRRAIGKRETTVR